MQYVVGATTVAESLGSLIIGHLRKAGLPMKSPASLAGSGIITGRKQIKLRIGEIPSCSDTHPGVVEGSPPLSSDLSSGFGSLVATGSDTGKLKCFQSSISSRIHFERSRILFTAYDPSNNLNGGNEQCPSCHTSSAAFTALTGCLSPSHCNMRLAWPAGEVLVRYGSLIGLIKK